MSENQFMMYKAINRTYWDRLERKEIERETVLVERFNEFFDILGVSHIDAKVFNEDYQDALARNYFLEDGAIDTVKALHGKVKQYVVSNGSRVAQEGKLEGSGLGALMDGQFISEEVGYEKPDVHFFDYVKNNIHYQPQTTLIVGDSLTSDIQGGLNASLHTCWFNPERLANDTTIKPEYTVDHLTKVIDLVNK